MICYGIQININVPSEKMDQGEGTGQVTALITALIKKETYSMIR